MPDNPVSNDVLLKIVERLDVIEQQMHKGFAALTQGQDDLRKDQEAMRKDLQTLDKRMEEGFAAEARERQSLYDRFEEFREWLIKELRENTSLLFDHILADRQKFESFREEMLKFKSDSEKFQNEAVVFQNFVKENLKYILNVLEKHEQHLLSIDELVALLHREFVEFKKERFIHDKEVQQRLSRLEAAA